MAAGAHDCVPQGNFGLRRPAQGAAVQGADGVTGDTTITIQVAGWAANTITRTLPAPDETGVLSSAAGAETVIIEPEPTFCPLPSGEACHGLTGRYLARR